MIIYRPVKTNWLTQKYGLKNTNPLLLKSYNNMGLAGHTGFDFKANKGEHVYWNCDLDGEVIALSTDFKLGYGVTVLTKERDAVVKHRHWHFMALYCKIGQILKPGDLMGWADSTGFSTGDHDHYDMKTQILVNGVLKNEFQDNGYFGAVDPEPYYVNIFILDYVMSMKRIEGLLAVIREMIKRIKENIALLPKGR